MASDKSNAHVITSHVGGCMVAFQSDWGCGCPRRTYVAVDALLSDAALETVDWPKVGVECSPREALEYLIHAVAESEKDTAMSSGSFNREALCADLLAVFDKYGVSVGVGLTRDGVALRSQDERVDARNIGQVSASSDKDGPDG